MRASKQREFRALFDAFVASYASTPEGLRRLDLYPRLRQHAQRGVAQIRSAREGGELASEAVVLRLLPYQDRIDNLESGAWVHVAPAFAVDVRSTAAGQEIDWEAGAEALWEWLEACLRDDASAESACRSLAQAPLAGVLTAEALSPILNALQPERFAVVNGAIGAVARHFTGAALSEDIGAYPSSNRAVQTMTEAVRDVLQDGPRPDARPGDVLETFAHWLVTLEGKVSEDAQAWRVDAGDDASWRAWYTAGYAALTGSTKLTRAIGDLNGLSQEAFEALQTKRLKRHKGAKAPARALTKRLWRFAQVRSGDTVAATAANGRVWGIGEVIGGYHYAPSAPHHRLRIRWTACTPPYDATTRWSGPFARLGADHMRAIQAHAQASGGVHHASEPHTNATPRDDASMSRDDAETTPAPEATPQHQPHDSPDVSTESAEDHALTLTEPDLEHPFGPTAFQLMRAMHEHPMRAQYDAHKEAYKAHVEWPLQQVLLTVGQNLTPALKEFLEVEKNLFGRIPKNDFGRGGAWDFYWGAFYPRGMRRIQAPQLFLQLDHRALTVGFSIGEYAGETRARFLGHLRRHRDVLPGLLVELFSTRALVYGDPLTESSAAAGAPGPTTDWTAWLEDPETRGVRVATAWSAEDAPSLSADTLVRSLVRLYARLFPLVLLASVDEPLTALHEMLGEGGLDPGPVEAADAAEEGDFAQAQARTDGLSTRAGGAARSLAELAEASGMEQAVLARWVAAIERKGQAILYGPPGTGKTWMAERLAQHLVEGGEGVTELVQFHPAYGYEDFIQGIRPEVRADGQLAYVMQAGRFLEFCRRAQGRQGRCVLIIDEINRADLSRVFGELMYLLEYRDREIPLASGGVFHIPHNVRLIGTMNTADRSIALVDHALRRRFAFLKLRPVWSVLRRYHMRTGFKVEPLVEMLEQINQAIDDPHYELGLSFFMRPGLRSELEDIWRMEIEPYLEEFFFDQPEKVEVFRWERIKRQVLR